MPAPLAIGSLVLGGIQAVGGLIGAMNMGRRPRFAEDPRFAQAAGRAEYMAGMGYTPQERAAFQSDVAAQTAGDYRRGIDMSGGNMARALGGISTARTMGAYNRFAGQDAALRRQNIQYADQFSRERQRRADMQTRADMEQYDAEQRALGQAMSSGLTQMAGAANFSQAMNFYGKQGMTGASGGGGGLDFLSGMTGGSNFGGVGFKNIYGGGGFPSLPKGPNLDFSPSIYFPTGE
jgi:hypothetical protein